MKRNGLNRSVSVAVMVGLLAAGALGQQSAQPTSGSASPAPRVDVVVVEMNRSGFSPSKVTHAANQHILYVRNVSGLPSSSLSLKDQTGVSWGQMATTLANPHWIQLLNLTAGTYTLTEANHPTWSCTITLQ